MKLIKMNLKKKILLGFVAVLILMLAIVVLSFYSYSLITEPFRRSLVQNYTSIVAADNMSKSLDKQLYGLLDLFSNKQSLGFSILKEAQNQFLDAYKEALTSAYTTREQKLLDELKHDYDAYIDYLYLRLDQEEVAKNNTVYKELYFREIIALIQNLKQKCYAIFDVNNHFMENIIREVDEAIKSAVLMIGLLTTTGIFLYFIFGTRFATYLSKPVYNLIDSVKRIAEGRFQERVEIIGEDEIAQLSEEFNKMAQKLESYETLNINKLLYEKEKFETIIQSMDEPVILVDGEGRILTYNAKFCEVFLFENPLYNLVQTVIPSLKGLMQDKPMRTSDSRFNKIEVPDSSGGKNYYRVVKAEVSIPNTQLSGFVFLFNNITQYEELDHLKSEFMGRVSHELKTPLTSIGMALSILGDKTFGEMSERQLELIDTMKEDYTRLNRLVKEILDLSKIESGSLKLSFEAVEMKQLLLTLQKAHALHCMEKRIPLYINIEEDLQPVSGDYEYLYRAVDNVLSNAIKFTDYGAITISARNAGDCVTVIISDTGVGIPDSQLTSIFNKFEQLKSNVPGSVGLGLSIAKEIIELHQGTLTVQSKVGSGSSFTFSLRVYRDEIS